jgi:septum formation protein
LTATGRGAAEARKSLKLVLASASPRRLALLKQIHIVPDQVVAATVDEAPLPEELPRVLCARLARAKAETALRAPEVEALKPHVVVLAADTVVACGRRVLPKAETADEARACLALLSGRRHRVLTGLVALNGEGLARARVVETRVQMKRLSEAEIADYLASGEWRGKAGGYAIQGGAAAFIPWINGSYSNVVGLPLYETASLLQSLGYTAAP